MEISHYKLISISRQSSLPHVIEKGNLSFCELRPREGKVQHNGVLYIGFRAKFKQSVMLVVTMRPRNRALFINNVILRPASKPKRVHVEVRRTTARMEVSLGRVSLLTGGCLLTGLLGNRLVLTPLDGLTATQSRADLLGVAVSAMLVLYGLARTEISERRARVDMGGVDIEMGFEGSQGVSVRRGSRALLEGVQGVKSVAVVVNGKGRFFMGKFREAVPVLALNEEGVIAKALNSGTRAYLADMKVVPVRETEFGFLPKECQSVLVQPVNEDVCVVVGADRPRPFTGQDFGWIQAICDRISTSLIDYGSEP